MRKLIHVLCGALVTGLVAGCDEPLSVQNPDQPERERVLNTPGDIENFIANAWVTVNAGTIGPGIAQTGAGANDALQPAFLVMGLESYSGNSNFAMATRGAVPRNFIDNSRGNLAELGNVRDWRVLHRAARSALLGLNRLSDPTFTLGSAAQDVRARAFAHFSFGAALGFLSLSYDSVSVMTIADAQEELNFPLTGYAEGMQIALQNLDEAIALATVTPAPAGANGFPLPASWLNSGTTTSAANFVRLVRSYKALFRANVARTPQERAAVDWTEVIDDANNGITADYVVNMSPTLGWDVNWVIQHYLFQSWTQMWQLIVGMGDTSGGFDTWLATPLAAKTAFVVVTPDERFPQGSTRTAQIADSPPSGSPPAAGQYFRNRPPGEDVVTSNTLANSFYDFNRFQAFRNATRVGPYPVLVKAVIDLLAAEGYIRTGQFALAAAKIDISRVGNGGLPPLVGAGLNDLVTPVPGGASCVPRVPVGPNFTSSACGNILEALKWEYRLESAYTGYGNWFFPGRGWGDLPEGTPLHFPVPFQEMDARGAPFYNLGGVGGPSSAARGNYGI
jgi:hypothetical protein